MSLHYNVSPRCEGISLTLAFEIQQRHPKRTTDLFPLELFGKDHFVRILKYAFSFIKIGL